MKELKEKNPEVFTESENAFLSISVWWQERRPPLVKELSALYDHPAAIDESLMRLVDLEEEIEKIDHQFFQLLASHRRALWT